jgi:hypothetical protein
MGSQTAPRVADDLVESKALQKRIAEESVEPEVLGKAAPRAAAADDISDAVFEEVTPTTGMDDLPWMSRMDPRLKKYAKVAGVAGAGGAAYSMMDKDKPPVQVPLAPVEPIKAESPMTPEEIKKEAKKTVRTEPPKQDGLDFDALSRMKKLDEEMAKLPKYQAAAVDFSKILQDAIKKREESDWKASLLRASEKLGAGLSRTEADHGSSDILSKKSEQFLKDAEAQVGTSLKQQEFDRAQSQLSDESAMRDPNSQISKQTVAQLAKYGIKVKTAQEAKQINPQIFNLLSQERAQANARELAQIAVKSKSGKGEREFVKGAQKVLLKPYQEFQKVDSAYKSLSKMAESEASGPQDVAMLYDFIKTLDPNSVVREGEIYLSKQGMGALESLGVEANRLTKGTLLSPAFRKGIVQIAKNKRDQAFSSYDAIRQPFLSEASDLGINTNEFTRFDYGSANTANTADTYKNESIVDNNPRRKIVNQGGNLFDANTGEYLGKAK